MTGTPAHRSIPADDSSKRDAAPLYAITLRCKVTFNTRWGRGIASDRQTHLLSTRFSWQSPMHWPHLHPLRRDRRDSCFGVDLCPFGMT